MPANQVCPHEHWVLRVHTTPHQSSHGPKACQASDPGTNIFFLPNNWDIMALSYKPYETVRHFMTFLVTSTNNQLGLMFALRPGQAICRHWLSSTRHVGRSLGPFQKINTTQIWHSEQEHHPISSVLQPSTIIRWTNPYPFQTLCKSSTRRFCLQPAGSFFLPHTLDLWRACCQTNLIRVLESLWLSAKDGPSHFTRQCHRARFFHQRAFS